MERLTFAGAKFNTPPKASKQDLRDEIILHQKYYDKLVEYEDAEEQGLLIKLPCKVGDTVYIICLGTNGVGKIIDSLPLTLAVYGFYNKVGKNLFLTREAAEEALKGSAPDGC